MRAFLNRVSAFHTLALLSLAPGQRDRHTVTTTLPDRGYGVCDTFMHTTTRFPIVQILMLRYADSWPPLIGVSWIAILTCTKLLSTESPISQ
jgi:hypothetical protein